MATINKNGTNGSNGTSGATPTKGGNGTAASYIQNGVNNGTAADVNTLNANGGVVNAVGGNGGTGGNGTAVPGADGGNGGAGAITFNGNIFNTLFATGTPAAIPTAVSFQLNATGGNGGLGGTGTTAGKQGTGGNATVQANGDIFQYKTALTSLTFDAFATGGTGFTPGNASSTVSGNIFQSTQGIGTVTLDALASGTGTNTAQLSGNVVQGNINNINLYADAIHSGAGTSTISGNILSTTATNTGNVVVEANANHIAITGNKFTLGKQEFDLVLNEFSPNDTTITGNTFTGTGTNSFVLTDLANATPHNDTAVIDLTAGTFVFDGQSSNAISGFTNVAVVGNGVTATLTGSAGNDTLTGGDGNDTFTGGKGNDAINGGNGIDTVIYAGNRADYTIAVNAAGNGTVTDNTAGRDGTDTLTSIERIQFADGTFNTTTGIFSLPNHAPVLDASKSPVLNTEAAASPAPVGAVGTLVSALVDLTTPVGGLDNVTDPDVGAVTGIALTGTDTANGSWFYSTNNGTTWAAVGTVSDGNALLLAADANTRLYFQPALAYSGTDASAITFRAWDQTSGTNGSTASVTVNGGTTAFSTASDTASITVGSTNHAPVATADTYTINEDGTLIVPAAGVLANDTDADGDTLTASLVTSTTHGSLTLNSNGSFTYTPTANYNGADSFTYTANDGHGGTSTATASITVNSVNDAPTGTDKTTTILEDGTYTFAASDFGFADASDTPANTLLAVKIDTLPGAGVLKLNGVAVAVGQSIAAAAIPTLTFTPAANANGAGYAAFTFQVQDNGGTANGGVDTSVAPNTFTFNVTPVNDAPLGTNATVTTNEDTAYTFGAADFGFSDPNDLPANALKAVEITTLPVAGTLTDNGVAVTAGQFVSAADILGGLLKFTPAANANGAGYAAFTFQVQDNGGTANGGVDTDPNAKSMTINVTPVNDAPVGTAATVTTLEDTAYTFGAADFGFTDPNDSPANTLKAVKITTLPAAGSLTDNGVAVTAGQFVAVADITGGLLKFTPAANANGSGYSSFTFQVQDNGGTANGGVDTDTTARTLTVNVTAVNDAPVGASNTVTTLEDNAYTFGATDFGFTDPSDTPANTLKAVQITTLPVAGSLTDNGVAVTAGQFVAVADITGGLLKFTPAANANGAGYASFGFKVQDNGGTANGGIDTDTTARTMTVNVTSVNDAPAGTDETVTMLQNGSRVLAAADFGFTDPNDSPANTLQAVTITTVPTAGSLKFNNVAVTAGQSLTAAQIGTGQLVYTPATGGFGTSYSHFTFQVQENGGTANGGVDTDQSPNTITFNVTHVDTAPVANADNYVVAQNGTLSVPQATGLLANDTDADNDILSIGFVTTPAHGSLGIGSNGAFTYTPTAGYSGTDTFTYQATDGTLNSNTATVTIKVDGAPVAADDSYTGAGGTPLVVTAANGVLANDTDPDGDALTSAVVTGPANGTLGLNPDGSFSYTPNAGFTGPDSFTYQANDGALNSAPATVSLNIVNGENYFGTPGNDTHTGTPFDDIMHVSAGTDVLDGGGYNANGDTLSFDTATSGVTATINSTASYMTAGGPGTTTSSNFQNMIGSSFDDVLTGDVNTLSLSGGAGNDTLVASNTAGSETLDGGAGSDTADFSQSTTSMFVNLNAGLATGTGFFTLNSIENVTGSDFGDAIVGSAGDNVITGGAGDDYFYASGGNDVLDGGGMIAVGNTADFSFMTAGGLVADLTAGTYSGGAYAGGASGAGALYNIQNLSGSSFNDTLIGDDNDNSLMGNDGNDILYGHGGTNTLDGGTGTNVAYYAGHETDYAVTGTTAVNGGPEGVTDTLTNVQRLKFLSPSHVSDTNNDGLSDQITQFHDGVANNTKIAIDGVVQTTGFITLSTSVVGTGLFDPDGVVTGKARASDILLQDTSSGGLSVYYPGVTTGPTALSGADLAPSNYGGNWKAVAIGDFNGDAASDVLLQNTGTKALEIFTMDTNAGESAVVDSVTAIAGPAGTSWKPIATGDFNGDGKSDILFQNSLSKAVEIYEMNGTTVTNTPTALAATGLTAIGTGDFNNDGNSDILFSNASGQAVIWLMNGDSHVGTKTVAKPGAGYTVSGTQDVDGNGYSDIVWTNGTNNAATTFSSPSSLTTTTVMNPNFGLPSNPAGFSMVASTGGA